MDRKAKVNIVPERVAGKGAGQQINGYPISPPTLALSIQNPEHETQNTKQETQRPAQPELGVKERALGAHGIPGLPLEPFEAKLVPKVLEMFAAREREGGFAFAPSLVPDIERGMKVDSRTAHRVFLFAMQRYVPGKPGVDAHMKR